MPWNYRVIDKDGELSIYEVFYDEYDGHITGTTKTPVFPSGPTIEGLKEDCELYMSALTLPVLKYVE